VSAGLGVDAGQLNLVLQHAPFPPARVGQLPGVGSALFDRTGTYRYLLTRLWGARDPDDDTVFDACPVWVMLNPSTATAGINDATISKLVGYAKRWGHQALMVVNLAAWISPSPTRLVAEHGDIGGPVNAEVIRGTLMSRTTGPVIAAWGAWAEHPRIAPLAAAMLRQLGPGRAGQPGLWQMGLTAGGQPKHPGRLAWKAPLAPLDSLGLLDRMAGR
jgi:hypothetical protein